MWDGDDEERRGERCSSPFRKETGNSPPLPLLAIVPFCPAPGWAVTLPRPSVRDPSSALWFGYLVDRLRRSAAAPLRTSPALPHAWDRDQTGRVGRNLSTGRRAADGDVAGRRGGPTTRPPRRQLYETNFSQPGEAKPVVWGAKKTSKLYLSFVDRPSYAARLTVRKDDGFWR